MSIFQHCRFARPALVLLGLGLALAGVGQARSQSLPSPAPAPRGIDAIPRMPLSFVENRGQVRGPAGYYVAGRDKTIYFTPGGLTYSLTSVPETEREPPAPAAAESSPSPPDSRRWTVKLDFLNANPRSRPVGEQRAAATMNYFTGPRDHWKTALPTYSQVRYDALWPGIDLVYSGTVDRLKYEFVVAPGADPDRIRLEYRGATSVWLAETGQLEVETPVLTFSDDRPLAYQEIDGRRVEVPCAYVVDPPARYHFRLGAYDRSRPLILDPAVLVFCGYLGGTDSDYALDVDTDPWGNIYLTGITSSDAATFPEVVGPDLTYGGVSDAFVAKVNPLGKLVYCGYLGGSAQDEGRALAVDAEGNAYIAGLTRSTQATFPVVVGPDLTANGGFSDAFVAKLDPTGTTLLYCGFVGGNDTDTGQALAVDDEGRAYLGGNTDSTAASFPETVGPDLSHNGDRDGFVARVQAGGAGLEYCGYLGGDLLDEVRGIAVDDAGAAYLTGDTRSTEGTFPRVVGPDLSFNGGTQDAYVAKVHPSGAFLVYCGYVGGNQSDTGEAIVVDVSGRAILGGSTLSTEATFPVHIGPDLTHNGSSDAFVARVNGSGTALETCGYVGGAGTETVAGMALSSQGKLYLSGVTSSSQSTFPVSGGPDLTYNGGNDGWVAKVSTDSTGLDFCTYLGGSDFDSCVALALDPVGNVVVVGQTFSPQPTFPVVAGPDLTYNGGSLGDAFVAKIQEPPAPPFYLGASSVTRNEVQLVWTCGSRNTETYRLERGIGEGGFMPIATLSAVESSHLDTDLNPGTEYQYRVRAGNLAGPSGYSNILTVTTTPNPPAAPTNLAAAPVSPTRVELTWISQSNNEEGFEIERRFGIGPFFLFDVIEPGSQGYSDLSCIPGATYVYRVRAFNSGGASAWVTTPTVQMPPSLPAAPTNLQAVPTSSGRVLLTWTDQSSNESRFDIMRSTGGGPFLPLGTVAENVAAFDDTSVGPSGLYIYLVLAANATGYSSPSNAAVALTPLAGKLVVKPAVVKFSPASVGTAARSRSLTIQNTGKGPLEVNVGALAAPFSVASGGGSFVLPIKGKRTVTFGFTPAAAGPATATLVLTSSDPARPTLNIPVSGTGR